MATASIATDLTCFICLELFKDPICLPCMHSFCKECLHQLYVSESTVYGKEFNCPACRRAVHLKNTGVEGLPKNFTLANIVENYSKNAKENKNNSESATNLLGNNTDPEKYPKSDDDQVMYCLQCQTIIIEENLQHTNHGLINYEEVKWNLSRRNDIPKQLTPANTSDDHSTSEDEEIMYCLQCRVTISYREIEQHTDHGLIEYQEAKWNLSDEKATNVGDIESDYDTTDPEEIKGGDNENEDREPEQILLSVPRKKKRFQGLLNELENMMRRLKKVSKNEVQVGGQNHERINLSLAHQENACEEPLQQNQLKDTKGPASFQALDSTEHLRGKDTLRQTDSKEDTENESSIRTKEGICERSNRNVFHVRNNESNSDDGEIMNVDQELHQMSPPVPKEMERFPRLSVNELEKKRRSLKKVSNTHPENPYKEPMQHHPIDTAGQIRPPALDVIEIVREGTLEQTNDRKDTKNENKIVTKEDISEGLKLEVVAVRNDGTWTNGNQRLRRTQSEAASPKPYSQLLKKIERKNERLNPEDYRDKDQAEITEFKSTLAKFKEMDNARSSKGEVYFQKKTPPPVPIKPKRRIFFQEKKPIKDDDYDIICEHERPVTRQELCARALYRYEASYDFEISFNPGDIIKNIEQMDEE